MGNVSSQSIILNFTKYSETSIIVNCYSLLNGYSSHIVKGVRSKKKSRFKLGHFQRLNLVEIENGNIKGNELSFLKNIKIISTYNSINSDVIKFNIAAFLSEVLSMILKNHWEIGQNVIVEALDGTKHEGIITTLPFPK